MKKITLFLMIAIALCSTATAETFVVARNGAEVSATRDGKSWSAAPSIDTKDPTAVLAAFFISYFEQTEEWKGFVSGFIGDKENSILCMKEDYETFYGRANSISVMIDPAQFKENGGGFAFYTVKIAYSYNGESGEGEDQVTLANDEDDGWLIVELPM